MGGIVGAITKNHRENIERIAGDMLKAIRHRGFGSSISVPEHNRIALGHVRLSVTDMSEYTEQTGAAAERNHTIVFDGRLYNSGELKKRLTDKGHRFKSGSDAEIILESYLEWGEGCLEYFNGMFAFAIWDVFKKEIFIARDRYGAKPLYYAVINGDFVFASEQKAIMVYPGFKARINPEAVKEYFTFQNLISEEMLLEGIKILGAGSYIQSDAENINESVPKIYWDYCFSEPEKPLTENEYIERFQYLFRNSVKRQLTGNEPIGAYLSGGMDSGSIAAVASKEMDLLRTFTCGFDLHSASGIEISYDEREKAEYMSYLFGTEHYEIVLKAGDMERCMSKLVWAIEEPRVGQTYPNYYIAGLASKFVKTVLTGAGGDELFGGYPWRYYRSVYNHSFDEYIDKYYAFWQRLVPEKIQKELLMPLGSDAAHVNEREVFKNVFRGIDNRGISPTECVNHSLYFEAKTFLHGLLVVEEKLSMAHGLEVRAPFLDNDLVEFAMNLPVNMKLSNLDEVIRVNENETGNKREQYYRRTKDGKKLMRKAMEDMLPKNILSAEKQGFVPPDNAWFRGESIQYIKDVISCENALMYDYLDKNCVRKIVNEHLTGQKNWRLFVWSVLVFNEWCRLFLK